MAKITIGGLRRHNGEEIWYYEKCETGIRDVLHVEKDTAYVSHGNNLHFRRIRTGVRVGIGEPLRIYDVSGL